MGKGEMDKGGLKKLRWIHQEINGADSPSRGWSEKFVQRAPDRLANDGCVARLCTCSDLTMRDAKPDIRQVLESIVPHLRGHSLWLLGEPGKWKTPLGRIIAIDFMEAMGCTEPHVTWTFSATFSSPKAASQDCMMMGALAMRPRKRKRHSQMLLMMKQ